jgi:hypothetical protein
MEDEEEEQPRKWTLGFSTDLTRKSASLQVSFTQIKPLSKNDNALQFLYLPVAFSLVILSPIVTIKLLKKSWDINCLDYHEVQWVVSSLLLWNMHVHGYLPANKNKKNVVWDVPLFSSRTGSWDGYPQSARIIWWCARKL